MHWFVQIALAVAYMHSKKVLHRDIKAGACLASVPYSKACIAAIAFHIVVLSRAACCELSAVCVTLCAPRKHFFTGHGQARAG